MSDKERSTVICHRCRWGAAPGYLNQCDSPDRDKEETGGYPAKWALPSIAAASGRCPLFAPVEVEKPKADLRPSKTLRDL